MTTGARVTRVLVPLYAMFLFMNLFPAMPGMTMTKVIQIMLVALTQTACAGGLVVLITLDPGKPADEPEHE